MCDGDLSTIRRIETMELSMELNDDILVQTTSLQTVSYLLYMSALICRGDRNLSYFDIFCFLI